MRRMTIQKKVLIIVQVRGTHETGECQCRVCTLFVHWFVYNTYSYPLHFRDIRVVKYWQHNIRNAYLPS